MNYKFNGTVDATGFTQNGSPIGGGGKYAHFITFDSSTGQYIGRKNLALIITDSSETFTASTLASYLYTNSYTTEDSCFRTVFSGLNRPSTTKCIQSPIGLYSTDGTTLRVYVSKITIEIAGTSPDFYTSITQDFGFAGINTLTDKVVSL